MKHATVGLQQGPRSRAAPLPPSERRAVIIAAALPLLRTVGPEVTTKQIARAAGVAEGTIFSVFGDKEELLTEAVRSGFDPKPTAACLAAIQRDLPLEDRLVQAVDLLQGYLDGVWQLMSTLGGRRPESSEAKHGFATLAEALVRLLGTDRSRLRVRPGAAGHLLISIVVATTHPMIADSAPPSSREVVDLFLDGARKPEGQGTI